MQKSTRGWPSRPAKASLSCCHFRVIVFKVKPEGSTTQLQEGQKKKKKWTPHIQCKMQPTFLLFLHARTHSKTRVIIHSTLKNTWINPISRFTSFFALLLITCHSLILELFFCVSPLCFAVGCNCVAAFLECIMKNNKKTDPFVFAKEMQLKMAQLYRSKLQAKDVVKFKMRDNDSWCFDLWLGACFSSAFRKNVNTTLSRAQWSTAPLMCHQP